MRVIDAAFCFDGRSPGGPRRLAWDAQGVVVPAGAGPVSGDVPTASWVLPGIANLHSHAFQRAMAGLAEAAGSDEDSFWTWRETMYRFAGRFSPDTVRAVATQLYVEMLEAGFTSVCEFHYLHHAPDGRPYAPATAMADALFEAAETAGLRITLLPVLYQRGGFDGRALSSRQARFGHGTEAFLRFHEALCAHRSPMRQVGIAFHSLRAVDTAVIREVLAARGDATGPLHVHIAEQPAEVEDCLAAHGQRPVERLVAEVGIDARWTLVHATHLSPVETAAIAASGATVALCPTTEANLGDGLFPLREFVAAGGRYGVGSDSHVSVSPVEELRWLEYGQRLAEGRRTRATLVPGSTAEAMLRACAASAAASTGLRVGTLAEGQGADWLVLDAQAPALSGAIDADVLDRFVFAGNRPLVREAWVAGRRVVAEGRHRLGEAAAERYAAVLRALRA